VGCCCWAMAAELRRRWWRCAACVSAPEPGGCWRMAMAAGGLAWPSTHPPSWGWPSWMHVQAAQPGDTPGCASLPLLRAPRCLLQRPATCPVLLLQLAAWRWTASLPAWRRRRRRTTMRMPGTSPARCGRRRRRTRRRAARSARRALPRCAARQPSVRRRQRSGCPARAAPAPPQLTPRLAQQASASPPPPLPCPRPPVCPPSQSLLQAPARKQARTAGATTPSGRAKQGEEEGGSQRTPATAAKATPVPRATPQPRPTPGSHAKAAMHKALQVGVVGACRAGQASGRRGVGSLAG
jgi:hypothetical protein